MSLETYVTFSNYIIYIMGLICLYILLVLSLGLISSLVDNIYSIIIKHYNNITNRRILCLKKILFLLRKWLQK